MTQKKTDAEKRDSINKNVEAKERSKKASPPPATDPVPKVKTDAVQEAKTEVNLDNPLIIKCLKCNVTFAREIELPKTRMIKCSCCQKKIKVNAGLQGS